MRRALARLLLRLTGWSLAGPIPQVPKFVLIAAPHTSNWDLLYLLLLAWSVDLRLSWLGKHTLFPPVLGWLTRAVGGIPVRRDRRNDLVAQLAQRFASSPRLVLTVPPEGTRGRAAFWKSGFYHIACAAGVPIVPGFLDYSTRRGGFGEALQPSGDVARDMDVLRAFYADKVARHPEHFSPPLLREEVDELAPKQLDDGKELTTS